VLILEYNATEILPGGAGNAANNVASLGGVVRLVSLVGRDEPGRRLFTVLPRNVERAGLSRPGGYRTPVKTRILAGGIHSAKQQVVRIDRYSSEPVSDAQRKAAERAALKAIRQADAVLVSDYGSGTNRRSSRCSASRSTIKPTCSNGPDVSCSSAHAWRAC
jgi:bifunctional ADP-heptose synthase (sugar kinase/adenylyltransferase)